MKKNLLIISILSILTAIVGYFYISKKSSTINEPSTLFAIKNIENVNRIFLTDTYGNKVDLKLKNGIWYANDEFKAKVNSINLVLKVIKDIRVQSSVEKSKLKYVLRRLASKHVKVEIYTGNEMPEKVWYIGDPTESNFGTFMLLETNGVKSNQVNVTDVPWQHGYLTPMFFTSINDWKDKTIFRLKPEEIKIISLKNHLNKDKSFSIERINDVYLIKDEKNEKLNSVDTIMISDYFKEFSYKSYETIDHYLTNAQKDSLIKSNPTHTFSLIDSQGNKTEIILYKKKQTRLAVDEIGEPLKIQPEFDQYRSYALINKKDLVLIQMQSFGKLLVDKTIFTK